MFVAAGCVDITPDRPLQLAGYLGARVSTEILDRLEASILIAQDAAGVSAILISFDLLYVGADLTGRIERHAFDRWGVPAANVVAVATHTHFAPATDRAKPLLGAVDDGYVAFVGDRVVELIDRLMAGRKVEAASRSGGFTFDGAVYRRLPWPVPQFSRRRLVINEPVMAPNPAVGIDTRLRLWEIADPAGVPLAIVWTLACHPTSLPKVHAISAEFVGVARQKLRDLAGADLPVLFLQGFSGDVRPLVGRRPVRSLAHALLWLSAGPAFDYMTPEGWDRWTGSVADDAAGALEAARQKPFGPIAGDVACAATSVPLAEVLAGDPEHAEKHCMFKRLRIGDSFDIFAVAAEVSNSLSSAPQVEDAIAVGCAGDVFGYWPTDIQRREGGYEGGRYFPAFSLHGHLKPGLDGRFAGAMKRLKAGEGAQAGDSGEDGSAEAPVSRGPRPNLRLSAIMGVAEQTFVGLSAFLVYALVLRRAGAADLGLWALVMTAAAVAATITFPNSNTLYHHVAATEGAGARTASVAMIETAVLMTIGVSLTLTLVSYFPFLAFIRYSVPADRLDVVEQMVPLVFLSIFLSNLSQVYLYALGALHRMYVRSALSIAATATLLAVTYFLFPRLGIVAAALGVIGRQAVMTVGGAISVKRNLPEFHLLTPRYDHQSARKLTSLSGQLQAMIFSLSLLEPLTRLFLGWIGAIEGISVFTVAWRIVQLPRGFVNSAILAVAPAFGSIASSTSGASDRLQRRGHDVVFTAMPVVTGATIGAAPLVSELLFGEYNRGLVIFTTLISLAIFWEGLSTVTYLRSIGEGRLKASLAAHLVMAGLNVVLGAAGGFTMGAKGVVLGLSLAIAIGSIWSIVANIRMFGGRWSDLAPSFDLTSIVASALAAISCLVIYQFWRDALGFWGVGAAMAACAALLVVAPVFRLVHMLRS